MSETSEIICQIKAEFTRTTDSLKAVLASTPDDKLNWSPSVTARTPLQVAAHAALWISRIQEVLSFNIYQTPFESIADSAAVKNGASIYAAMRELEEPYTTREQVLDLLETSSAAYLAFLDGIAPEKLETTVDMRFDSFPLAIAITFNTLHVLSHVAQIEYIQTVYGDHDWH
jgi:hypothetical protein